jgi:hypothetical protein
MPYIYRVSRRTERQPSTAGVTVSVAEAAPPEPSYRDLQAQAKALDIKANQPADDLKKAIEKASGT